MSTTPVGDPPTTSGAPSKGKHVGVIKAYVLPALALALLCGFLYVVYRWWKQSQSASVTGGGGSAAAPAPVLIPTTVRYMQVIRKSPPTSADYYPALNISGMLLRHSDRAYVPPVAIITQPARLPAGPIAGRHNESFLAPHQDPNFSLTRLDPKFWASCTNAMGDFIRFQYDRDITPAQVAVKNREDYNVDFPPGPYRLAGCALELLDAQLNVVWSVTITDQIIDRAKSNSDPKLRFIYAWGE